MRWCLAFLLLCAAQSADGQRLHTYEVVGGDLDRVLAENHEGGSYLPVRPQGRKDTLWMYLEGVNKEVGPDTAAARVADIVVWCYPAQYPDPRHPLPEAEKVALTVQRKFGKTWLYLAPPAVLEEAWSRSVSPEGSKRNSLVLPTFHR